EGELRPIDAVKREMIVRIPEQQAAVAQASEIERVGDERHGVGDMPLLTEHDDGVAAGDRRLDVIRNQRIRKAAVEVRHLVVLAVVDPHRVIPADPLAPAMDEEPPVQRAFIRRQAGVAHEEQVGLIAALGEGAGEFLHPHPQPAGLGVDIGALEGQQDEGGLERLQHQETRVPSSCRAKAWISNESDASKVVRESSRTDTLSTGPPSKSVARPPASRRISSGPARSNARTGAGVTWSVTPPAAVWQRFSAAEPSCRTFSARARTGAARPRASAPVAASTGTRGTERPRKFVASGRSGLPWG